MGDQSGSHAGIVQAVLPGVVVSETAEEIVFDTGERRLCALRKVTLAQPALTPDPQVGPQYYEGLLAALDDPLAERVLAEGEPDYEMVAGLLPPLLGPAFVGHNMTVERVEIAPDAGVCRLGLLDGWLPVVCHLAQTETHLVEQIVFGACDAAGSLVTWRRLASTPREADDPAAGEIIHQANGQPAPSQDFYAALLDLWQEWRAFRRRGLRLRLPEPDLTDAAQAMLQLGVLTFRGLSARYGVGPYDQEQHGGFPPATLFLLHALLAWGHTDLARDHLCHYVSRFFKPDGTVDYYGPAVAEYGQLLALMVEYVRVTQDHEWLRRRLTLVRPMWRRLLALRAESKQRYPADDTHHGLIPGLPEADYHAMAEQWQTFYYSGDVWACRGLREMGRLLQEQDAEHLRSEGGALLDEAAAYEQDILRSLQQTTRQDIGYVPPGPDQTEPILNLTADQHASYCNYRYFPEMMSAGVLPREALAMLAQWRRSHGGELLGMTRFEGQLDDWPALHVARALLELDEVDRYLLLMHAHRAHHCATGTLASYEQVSIRPDESGFRTVVAGQVLPCQVMVPIMLRWALLYEEREADVLWLCRAIPRHWLSPGQPLRVRRVPTRFGEVGFTIKVDEQEAGEIKLRLPSQPLRAQIKLRLRRTGRTLVVAQIKGVALPVEDDVVTIPAGLSGRVGVKVQWARTPALTDR